MNIDKLIGNTPMIKIKLKYKNKIKNVYAKLEYYNYTGSIKDRVAKYIIDESIKNGSLKSGQPIIEATSGNTGISFSALGALYKNPVHIFMPDWVSVERIKIMELYGAKVHLISKEQGGFKRAISEADKLAKEINGFRPNQFSNIQNIEAHYLNTGQEIVDKLNEIDAFVSGIGTGGTLIGVGKKIKEHFPNSLLVALEPEDIPLLSKGKVYDSHKIEGIGDDFIPELVDVNLIDRVITLDDEDAINMSRILSKNFGLGVGISSGANLLAAASIDRDNIVTVFADDIKKYLTTDLVKDINNNKKFISNNIEIISIESI